MSNRANYAIVVDGKHVLVIRDLGPWDKHSTVTNDAERVVRELLPVLNGRRLLYFDSEERLDELLITCGRFDGFRAYCA